MTDPVLSQLAARAYASAARPEQPATQGTEAPDFGELVQEAARQVSLSGSTVETAMGRAAYGHADLIDVVTAVAAAEANLETVIAVRDQFVKAYQEVMRMPI